MAAYIPHCLQVGSVVEVWKNNSKGPSRYGVIRWIGNVPQMTDKMVAGLEMEEEDDRYSNGKLYRVRYFTCPPRRGLYTLLENCRQDSRVASNTSNSDEWFYADKGTNSLDLADIIIAAGESSRTDTEAFIEQQRRILAEIKSFKECDHNNHNRHAVVQDEGRKVIDQQRLLLYGVKSAKISGDRDTNEDVDVQDEDRTSQMDFQDDHFRNTPPNCTDRENRSITKHPGHIGFVHQETARKLYADYDNIKEADYETLIGRQEGKRGSSYRDSTVLQSQQGFDSTESSSLATEVVADGCPGTSEEMDETILSKEPSVQPEIQTAEIHSEATAADRKTDINRNQMAVAVGLQVGSMVEVPLPEGLPRYGVIRWIGYLPQLKDKLVAGLEVEEDLPSCSDGTFCGQRYFTCPGQRAFFTLLEHCRQDSRVASKAPNSDANVHADEANRGKDPEKNFQSRMSKMEQQLTNVQGKLQEKELQLANLHEQLREREQQLTPFQRQLQEKEFQEASLHEQLREMAQRLTEKGEQEENLQRQLRENEQQLTHFKGQLQEKELQEASLQVQLREMSQRLTEKGEQEENLQRQLRENEQQLTHFQRQSQEKELQQASLHEQLREKEQQEQNLQRQMREMEQQLTDLQEQCREKENESGNLQQQVTTLQGQLRTKDQEVNELESTLSRTQQALREQQCQQSPDWVISRDQIQLTGKVLGRGGWGSVVEAKYCHGAVAVKQIDELILSPHNRNLFLREMDIASRCRHPCLLQFIGATNDEGSPLFVTELMELSLRALLEQRSLSAAEVYIISLDVARALSYLHHKTPPIIHRDISSANVLLWRQGDKWRGKVSDYGTANFMQHTMTVGPGAPIYMAPEARTSNQTIKVDVYSFGVLLCEMCIRELPDPERCEQQIDMVTIRLLRALIRRCVNTEPESRPNMDEIIEELEKPL